MGASLLYNQTCFLDAVSSGKEKSSLKKYLLITAGQGNVETSSPVNTLHDAPQSTNQKTPLPVGVKETLARQPKYHCSVWVERFPGKKHEIFSRNCWLVYPSISLLICRWRTDLAAKNKALKLSDIFTLLSCTESPFVSISCKWFLSGKEIHDVFLMSKVFPRKTFVGHSAAVCQSLDHKLFLYCPVAIPPDDWPATHRSQSTFIFLSG